MYDKIGVNDEELKILLEYKNETLSLQREIHSDIMPLIADGIRQIRELTQNLIIICSAIAAFTIPIVGQENVIQVKAFAFYALALLFLAIVYGVYHLSEIIPKEVNSLSKQHSVYIDLVNESLARIYKVIETGKSEGLIQFDKQQVLDKLSSLKEKPVVDRSLNIMRTLLFTALLSLSLSFISTTLWGKLFDLFHWSTHMQTVKSLINTLDLANAILGGLIGYILVILAELYKRPKAKFAGFEKTIFNIGGTANGNANLYKIIFKTSPSTGFGLSQIIIKHGEKNTYAKWDENPNPVLADNAQSFLPEMVPLTTSLFLYPKQTYKVPILHEDGDGKYTIFSGWWFGKEKGYGHYNFIAKKEDKITIEIVGQNIIKTIYSGTIDNIINEVQKKPDA